MARRKNRKKSSSIAWFRNFELSSEVKHSILVILVLLLAILMILGLFDMAGFVGIYLVKFLKLMFGRGYFLYPFIFFLVGLFIIDSERFGIKPTNYFGLVILILSFSGLLHIRKEPLEMSWEVFDQMLGGGYVGWFITTPFFKIMGFWATLIVLIALFMIAIFLTFNTSLRSVLNKVDAVKNIRERISSWWYHLFHKDEYTNNAEESEEEEEDEEVEGPEFSGKGLEDVDGEQQQLEVDSQKRKVKIELPINLLDPTTSKPTSGDIQLNKEKIKKALQNFGIEVEMGDVSVGPTVTQYTLCPSNGVKLSSILALQNDLALALAAHPIRLEAPIPGKSLVGVEVPNESIATVMLREVIGSKSFVKNNSSLTMGIGKDVAGKIWTADLATMPHLLIAGATGSGKSVCINTIIVSLLYQNNPDDLKFILVDPKRVELSAYNNLPYLMTPVITDTQKTINALKWIVNEMDERYIKLQKTKHKNIETYNKDFPNEKMPYIVLIIDELADLMVTAAQEVEAAIIRLAQMARAVGIHLILATQRPSVNVITGLIKANITSRIAFAVASGMDSRTILDTSGAEKLLGRGDMLFISANISKPKRLQAAFLSEDEIQRVTGYIKKQTDEDMEYDDSIVEKKSRGNGAVDMSTNDEDMYDEARELVIKTQKASASYLQRRLRVGYSRAARLLDLLEDNGIIGPSEGAKPREVLVGSDADEGYDIQEVDEVDEIEEE